MPIFPENAKLCYIDPNEHFAYFTTSDLDKFLRDDFDSAYYDSNASGPYPWSEDCSYPKYELIKLRFNGPYFKEPIEDCIFSPDELNRAEAPWLRKRNTDDVIWAGATPEEFITFVKTHGGCVWDQTGEEL